MCVYVTLGVINNFLAKLKSGFRANLEYDSGSVQFILHFGTARGRRKRGVIFCAALLYRPDIRCFSIYEITILKAELGKDFTCKYYLKFLHC